MRLSGQFGAAQAQHYSRRGHTVRRAFDPGLYGLRRPVLSPTVVGGACVCDPGFAKGPSASEYTNLCIASNLGATCAADADCAGGTSPHCQIPTGAAAGYCTTTGCASNADCNATEKYACAASANPTFCRRAPLNEGNACAAQGLDPTCGAEAPVCFIGHCAMIGCAADGDCSPSRKCCDESALASLPKGSLQVCLEACL